MFKPMRLLLVVPVLALSLWTASASAAVCSVPDDSFAAFLGKFKDDERFRESRLVLPLHATFTDPDGTSEESLSLKTIHERQMKLVIGTRMASELKGSEGELCEPKPVIKGDRAKLVQYSCGTDVYSKEFDFVRVDGCWRLKKFATAGG